MLKRLVALHVLKLVSVHVSCAVYFEDMSFPLFSYVVLAEGDAERCEFFCELREWRNILISENGLDLSAIDQNMVTNAYKSLH